MMIIGEFQAVIILLEAQKKVGRNSNQTKRDNCFSY